MTEREPLPPFGWADILFRLSGHEIEQRALASGAPEPVATRLSQLVEVMRNDVAKAPLTFADLVAEPDRVLSDLDQNEFWRAASEDDDWTESVLVPRLDLAFLVGLLLDRFGSIRVTGVDLYARVSHSGPPHLLAMSPPPEPSDRRPTLRHLLRKWAQRPLDGSWIAASRRVRMQPQGRIADLNAPEQAASAAERPEIVADSISKNVGPLLARAYAMFRTDTGSWLSRPNLFLDDLSPLDCLATPEGRRRLDEYLTRLELGFPI